MCRFSPYTSLCEEILLDLVGLLPPNRIILIVRYLLNTKKLYWKQVSTESKVSSFPDPDQVGMFETGALACVFFWLSFNPVKWTPHLALRWGY